MRFFLRNRGLHLVFYNLIFQRSFLWQYLLIFVMEIDKTVQNLPFSFCLILLFQGERSCNNCNILMANTKHTMSKKVSQKLRGGQKEDKGLFAWSWPWIVFCIRMWEFVGFCCCFCFVLFLRLESENICVLTWTNV